MCWNKFKTDATQQKFLIQFPEKKGFLRYGGATPQFYNYLSGKILFLGMVRGAKDEMFLKFKTDFDKLKNEMNGNVKRNSQAIDTVNSNLPLYNLLKIWETQGIETAIKQYRS